MRSACNHTWESSRVFRHEFNLTGCNITCLSVFKVCSTIELRTWLFFEANLKCHLKRKTVVRAIVQLTSLRDMARFQSSVSRTLRRRLQLKEMHILITYITRRMDETYLPDGQITSPGQFCTLPYLWSSSHQAMGHPEIHCSSFFFLPSSSKLHSFLSEWD